MDATTTITLSLPPDTLMILLVLVGLGLASYVIFAVLPKSDNPARNNPIDRLATSLGFRLAGSFEATLLFLVICVYALVFAFAAIISLRALGGILLVPNTDVTAPTQPRAGLAFGTLLAAILGAPLIIWRSWIAAKQTAVAEESLFNDKINAAATDLAARRQVTRAIAPGGSYTKHQDFWDDDLVTRAAAIDRLEGLAQEAMDRGDYSPAQRVARMLSIYVQELSRAHPAKTPPENATPNELHDWARALIPIRPDMERAAQSLGRINPADAAQRALFDPKNIDLRRCNLQGFDLADLTFQGANLVGAQLQGADLRRARLQGARLLGAELQGANLRGAQLQGAYLEGVEMSESTDLTGASLGGAAATSVDETTLVQLRPHWDTIILFARTLPDEAPAHWVRTDSSFDYDTFISQWRAFAATLDPPVTIQPDYTQPPP